MTRYPKRNRVPITDSIPRELVTEILSRVAASSVADISNIKLSCKELREIAEDREVYRRSSLDKFPFREWVRLSDEQQNFIDKCRQSDNPELCYREAVSDFFSKRKFQSAYQNLDKALEFGHMGAQYLTCIVLLLSGNDEQKREGIKLISKIKKCEFSRKKLRFCRTKLKEELRQMWVENPLLRRPPVFCRHRRRHRSGRIVNKWLDEEEDRCEGEYDCEACDADKEVEFISSGY